MIKFAIEEAALTSNDANQGAMSAAHARLLNLWLRFGIFVGNVDKSQLTAAVSNMPSATRKMWQIALTSEAFRREECEFGDPSDLFVDEGSICAMAGSVDVVGLEDTRASLILDDGDFCKSYPGTGFEICRFDALDESESFRNARRGWDQPILAGESRAEMWKGRFSHLTHYARRISIVDRYAGTEMVLNFGRGKLCGLARFLSLLNSEYSPDQKQKAVSIFVSDKEVDRSELVSILRKVVAGNKRNLASVRFYVAPDSAFRPVAHDRFVRFDKAVVSIGRGVSVLAEDVCSSNSVCSLHTYANDSFEIEFERSLQRVSEPFVIL